MVGGEVAEANGELGDALGDEFGFELAEGEGEGEFADVAFDGDFPEGDDAGKDDRGGFDAGTGAGGQLGIIFEEPEEGVGVEEDGHDYM
jgi:hypothetical protein